MTNPAGIYAMCFGPMVALLLAAVPFPLRLGANPSKRRVVWFRAGLVWLGTFIASLVLFTVWWIDPDRWWGSFYWGSLILPLWIFGLGAVVATVRLVRRIKAMAGSPTTEAAR
ncbi:hypothetical protein [Krasilnikovia sp. MM14-A1259]|uniref:hypothetical protein n=1 Tax=Krasilnikovia sp. MM14-A1259 TaxID=3373539 RepID=UPI00399CC08F